MSPEQALSLAVLSHRGPFSSLVLRRNQATAGDRYVDRPSPLGNPFYLRAGADNQERLVCVAQFAIHLISTPHLLALLPGLRDTRLVCYCAPLLCNGHVIAHLANCPDAEYLRWVGQPRGERT